MNNKLMPEKIGFIGLGTMGKPMAINLSKKGFSLTVRDINHAPVKELLALGAREGLTPKKVARHSTIVITMLFNDSIAKEVVLGKDGVI
jgi:3-hydroxyisobutyrate dehydrogenase-like beta-hydroxyacid dehydrogenase